MRDNINDLNDDNTEHTKKIDEVHTKSTQNCMHEPDMPFSHFKHLICPNVVK